MAGDGARWEARPRTALVVRLLAVLVPALAGALAGWGMSALLPEPSGWQTEVAWWGAVIAAVVTVVLVAERLARRLLPLAWLLTLSLAFPDRAPSRMVVARRAARRRSLHEAVDDARRDGLGADSAVAAEQALVLVAALGAHDRRTRGHSERVRSLADVLAEEVGVSGADRDRLRWAALLHDIGKLTVPERILNKPDRPDEQEWATLRRHPAEGGRLVAPLVTWLGPWADSVAHHHERWDGAGYPDGLAGEDISLGARILAVSDAYEVMTAARPYKQPMRPGAARRELVHGAGSHFDPELVRRFLGISVSRLWWLAGGSSALAMLPVVGRWWTVPGADPIRQAVAAPAAVAAVVVAGLALIGGLGSPDRPDRAATGRTGAAAPSAPSPGGEITTPPAGRGSASAAPTTTTPPPVDPAVAADVFSDVLGEVLAAGPAAGRPEVQDPGNPGAPTTAPAPSEPAPAGDSATPADPVAAPPPPPPASPPPPPARYSASATILLPGLLGLTGFEAAAACGSPLTQGVDGAVFDVPADARVAGAPVRVSARGGLGTHDLDVVFYSDRCDVTGRLPAGTGTGELPADTRFIFVTDRTGFLATVDVTVG